MEVYEQFTLQPVITWIRCFRLARRRIISLNRRVIPLVNDGKLSAKIKIRKGSRWSDVKPSIWAKKNEGKAIFFFYYVVSRSSFSPPSLDWFDGNWITYIENDHREDVVVFLRDSMKVYYPSIKTRKMPLLMLHRMSTKYYISTMMVDFHKSKKMMITSRRNFNVKTRLTKKKSLK